jgi:mono/diheme cytochrome c family protein
MKRITMGLLPGLLAMATVVVALMTGAAKAQPISAYLQTEGENCVVCHTSKETLQELAVEPEEEEELSEGEG